MLKYFLSFCFTFLPAILLAQSQLSGVVLDEAARPITGASVFLANTSIGTTTNEEGNFELSIPAGRFELVVSSVGFQTFTQTILPNDRITMLTVHLKIKAPELETVIIESFEKNGWEKWGQWFIDNFLGTSEYGHDCRIKNPEVLKFRNSKIRNELTVIATAPLVIENKSLGYFITYQLENFHYDFKTRYLLYAGYPFFETMPGSDRKQRGWEKAREDVYYGSMLHFMRALYRNRLTQEGFEVRALKKIPNAEKERVRMVYKTSIRSDAMGRMTSTINNDSSAYYNHIMSQEDYKNSIGAAILTGDSIAYAVDSITAGLNFNDYLLVICKQKKMPVEYKQLFLKTSNDPTSELSLINGKPIDVLANGSYFSPEDLLSSNFWGWWEKMGTMLPFNYQPPKK